MHGTWDITNTPRLRNVLLQRLAEGNRHLLVDLTNVDLLDCSAVGVFVFVRNHAEQQGGSLRAVAAAGIVLRLLEVVELARSFHAYDTLEQSLATPIGTRDTDGKDVEDGTQTLLRVISQLPPAAPERPVLRAGAIELSVPLATRLARRFHDRGEPQDDLDQAATVGLVKAVDRYDAARGTEFASFAVPTIMGEVRRHFRDKGWRIRVPRYIQELRRDMQEISGDLVQRLGRFPTTAEVAACLGVSRQDVLAALAAGSAYRPASLSAPVQPDKQFTLADQLAVIDRDLDAIDVRESLRPAIAQLPAREQRIIAMRFYANMTQAQIGAEIGLSQMHVSRLLSASLQRLRRALLSD
jgi:RNA polymerase sigma-B factor